MPNRSKAEAAQAYQAEERVHNFKLGAVATAFGAAVIYIMTHQEQVGKVVSDLFGTHEPVIESVPGALRENRDNRDRVIEELTSPTPKY